MKLAFVLDPLESLKAYKDSSIAMMREAARRGHEVHALESRSLCVRDGKVRAAVRKLAVSDDDGAWYRAEVARDLEALMNNIALQSTLPLVDFPAVAKSVLNYGFPDITHRSIDELGGADIGTEIEQALRTYEPRLARNTIHVVRDTSIDPADLKIRYIVRGELRSRPLNVPIEFIADVEVTTGNIVLRRLT